METDDVGKLQKEIRSLKKQVERLETSRATFELMVDRNDNLLSRQLEQTQRQAEELNRINLLADSALELTKAGYQGIVTTWPFGPRMLGQATKRPPRSRRRTLPPPSPARSRCMTRPSPTSDRSMGEWSGSIPWGMW